LHYKVLDRNEDRRDIRGVTTPTTPDQHSSSRPGLRWAAAAGVALLGAWTLYNSLPGINWVLWTGAAVAGLFLVARTAGRPLGSILFLGAGSIALAGAAAITSSPPLWFLIFWGVVFLLALQMLLAAGLTLRSISLWFAALAPLQALRLAGVQSLRQSGEAIQQIRSNRARAWVRGLGLTLPVLIVFALLFAGADPVFAAWRDAVKDFIGGWEFVGRVVFFLVLLVIVLGAYGYAASAGGTLAMEARTPNRWLGATERLILLGSVAALFWLFLAIQIGYLFGNLPSLPTAGVTFAEYARRGFAALTVVASVSALLIVISERYGNADRRQGILRLLTFAVIAAVLLLLGSAFRRVMLYEEAYGFTTARLYAQFYMGAVAAALVFLFLEVTGGFDAGRLFRRVTTAAALLFLGLAYWNHEAWIARRNLDRFASTGKLDITYLARELSPDAVPAIAERVPSLPEPTRSDLWNAVRSRYEGRNIIQQGAWYEWNRSRHRAREALVLSLESP